MQMNTYQQFIHQRTYARWDYEQGRREMWRESVRRYFRFFEGFLKAAPGTEVMDELETAKQMVTQLDVMPSMRALMTAGPALEKDNVAGFNCSYVAIDHPRAFEEIVYILMCGTGVGFSVERQFIKELPEVPDVLYNTDTVIIVRDSKVGWAKAFGELIMFLYQGRIPHWDVSLVRPAGAVLRTFGGRASGPDPLVKLFKFTINLFKSAAGRKLESIEVHDLVCMIGDVVVSGGVRRSALISLSNLSDQRMRDAKMGGWHQTDPHRRLANNSAAYTERPEVGHFMQEWMALYYSKSGERGIFNRSAAVQKCESIGRETRTPSGDPIAFGTNPCGEIILRSAQFCNLSEVVARQWDTYETLMEKVRVASFLGTIQSCLTDYRFLRGVWKANSEEERLLGVSITGIMDCPVLSKSDGSILRSLKDVAFATNIYWAKKLDIPRSAAITCVKPSGTVSQLVDASSGIHPRCAPYYVRRVRVDVKDPLCAFLQDNGFSIEPDVMSANQVVASFPMMAPEGTPTGKDVSALDQLRLWKVFRENWCDHNPSTTITLKEKDWPSVGAWVWDNFDDIGGLAFLPEVHGYQQLPEEEITKDQYDDLVENTPVDVDWSFLSTYEEEDFTTSSQEFACVGGQCEV